MEQAKSTPMVNIRNEVEADYKTVEDMTRKAFWNLYVPGCDEHYLVHVMRAHEDFLPELDFVMEVDRQVMGNIMYTKARLADDAGEEKEILTFGPVSILPEYQRMGYGKLLMEYCLADAKEKGKSGICMLGAKKQKSWLTDQSFAKNFGFKVVDTTDNGYELLALSFDGTTPKFAENVKCQEIESKDLTIYYDMQCPYVYQSVEKIKQYCEINEVPVSLIQVDTQIGRAHV